MQDKSPEALRLYRNLSRERRERLWQRIEEIGGLLPRPSPFERALAAVATSRALLLASTFVNVFFALALLLIYPDPHSAARLLVFLLPPPNIATLLFITLGNASGRFRRIPVERTPNILIVYTAFLMLFIVGAFFSTPPLPIALLSLCAYIALVFLSALLAVWMGYALFHPRAFARWMV